MHKSTQSIKAGLQKTFLDIIAINEIYPNEKVILEYIERRLNENNIHSDRDAFGNIIAKITGTGEAILLSTHVDIPEPAPDVKYVVEGDLIKSDGSNILGADPKTGLAILIELVLFLSKEDPQRHAPVEFVFTRGEEAGLHGARNLDYSLLEAKLGLELDEEGRVNNIATHAPGFVRIDATFEGKTVHPCEPEKGINALQMASEALQALPWGYITKDVTWNVGMFTSGTARNSVPGKATLKAELRSHDTTLAVEQGERVEQVFQSVAKKHGGVCIVERNLEFEGYKLDGTHPLFQKIESVLKHLSLSPNYIKTFGGTDANIFNAHGIVSVPIGSGYYNAHQYTEYADLNDMAEIFTFLHTFVAANN